MNFKCLTCGSAIALAIGASALTAGSGVAAAQPGPANSGITRAPVDRADTIKGPRRMGTTRDAASRPEWTVGPVDRLLPAACRRETTAPPGGHRRPIRAGVASMTAGAITSHSTTTAAG